MKTHELIYTIEEVPIAAKVLTDLLPDIMVFTFSAPLGGGKTTLIQAFLAECGVTDYAPSPTFTYLSTYTNPDGMKFYHFDLYRIKNINHFYEAGFEEYLYQPQSCALIEWPEVIMPLLQHKVCHCFIEYYGNDRRKLVYTIQE